VGRRTAALGLVAVAALAAPAPSAQAHARLVHADPADGTALRVPPRTVRLRFDEAISPRFRIVRLVDAHGRVVAGTALHDDRGGHELVLEVPRGLARGAYDVTWEVLAQDDGHVTGGAVVFGVGTRPPAGARVAATAGSAVSPLAAWLRWIDLAVLCALIGTLGMAMLLARLCAQRRLAAAAVAGPQRSLRRAALAAAGAGLVLGVALLAREVALLRNGVLPGTGVTDVLGVRWGELWLVREALLLIVVAGLVAGGRGHAPRRVAAFAVAPAVGGLVVVHALGGHAAAEARPAVAVSVAAAHVLAAGAWMGGVAGFALALSAARGARTELARACRRPFGRAAGAAVFLLAVTGLLETGRQVASIDALLTTDYGTTLLLKSALVLLALALGLGNALLLARGAAPRLLAAEAGTGLSVLLAAAVLAASPPAKGREFAPPRPVVAPEIVRHAGDLLVTASVRPNRPGANVVTVLAVSSRRPAPGPVQGVRIAVAGRELALAPVGSGRFVIGVPLEKEGALRASLLLTRAGRRTAVPLRWVVAPPDQARPVVHSSRRLAPLVNGAAAALLAAAALAALLRAGWRAQRRRRVRAASPGASVAWRSP
jgi:copper transport protein